MDFSTEFGNFSGSSLACSSDHLRPAILFSYGPDLDVVTNYLPVKNPSSNKCIQTHESDKSNSKKITEYCIHLHQKYHAEGQPTTYKNNSIIMHS